VLLRGAENLHNASKLLLLVLSREDRIAGKELRKNAAQTPHVNRQAVAHTQNYLRRSIETRLDVRVHFLVFEAAGSKIDNLDLGVQRMRKQDVLGFQIAVNDPLSLQQNQRGEHLFAKATDESGRKALELVSLDELVQVHTKELSRDTQMATEVEALCEVDHAVLVIGVLH
jgi:hypothetical protein